MYHSSMENDLYLRDEDDRELERPALESRWPAPLSVVVHPPVEGVCDGEMLVFDYGGSSPQPGRVCITKSGLLRSFTRLAGASPALIAAFARAWGALSLAGIGFRAREYERSPIRSWEPLPAWYAHHGIPEGAEVDIPVIVWEPVAMWREMAKDAHRVLTLAGKYHYEQSFDEEESGILRQTAAFMVHHIDTRDEKWALREAARWYTLRAANRWMGAARITPCVADEGFTLHTHSLGAALGLQLALATVAARGFVACEECGALFTPPRRPRRGYSNYCPHCQHKGVPRKRAEQEYQGRKRTGEAPRYPRKDSHADSQER